MRRSLALLIPALAVLTACTSTVYEVQVNPGSANISVMGQPPAVMARTAQGAKITIPSGDAPYTVTVSEPGYETGSHVIAPGANPDVPIRIELSPLFLDREVAFNSQPEGAQVYVDGKLLGVTPLRQSLRFERSSAKAPWKDKAVEFRMKDWQSESAVLASSGAELSAKLSQLRLERKFTLRAVTSDGHELAASVSLGDKALDNAPLSIPLVYERQDKSQPWPVFQCNVGIVDEYKSQQIGLTRDTPDLVTVTLEPVTELGVRRMAPVVQVGPRGAQLVVDSAERNASVDTNERAGSVADLRPVTSFRRSSLKGEQVNSFTVSPDGQFVVYALTEKVGEAIQSNLWQVSTQMAGGARQSLTSGPYMDTMPQLPLGEGRQMLVFQSNRGMRDSVDISAIRLVDGRAVGGITQITREARFNFCPVLLREEWELFFISMEDRYPQAVPQISYMRVDGSAPSYLNENGNDLALSPDGRQVYFSRKDSITGRSQIYSVPMEGYPLTQVIAQAAFNNANCFQPSLSPDGNLMLFVSDMAQDASGRRNNDIYVLNMTNGRIEPVTSNISDDIMPAWSPSETGVVYFLSNRGGCYNVWRLRLTDLQ